MSTCLRCSVIKQIGVRMEELFDKKTEMKEGDYLKQTNCIKQMYDKLETTPCDCEKKEYLHLDDFIEDHGLTGADEIEIEVLTDEDVLFWVVQVEPLLQMHCHQRYMIHNTETGGTMMMRDNATGAKQNLFKRDKAYELYDDLITGNAVVGEYNTSNRRSGRIQSQ